MAIRRMPVTEIAEDVYQVALGPRALASNVYLIRAGAGWVLVDTAWPGSAEAIRRAAKSIFGPAVRPQALLLTHIHPDHSGSAARLAHTFRVPVFVHRDELPFASGNYQPRYANPLDRWLLGPVLRLMPARARARLAGANDLTDIVRELDERSGVPALPDWECVPTPGHTPGHAAFYRPGDGLLISGDSVLTVNLNSPAALIGGAAKVFGPPRYTTWRWPTAVASIGTLAALHPRILAPGHGKALHTNVTPQLNALLDRTMPGPYASVAYGGAVGA
jgi:glyoxylase-like metal-dependent hydrolase (beta-lactamase superfamily II)